jgi:hypothetical protein
MIFIVQLSSTRIIRQMGGRTSVPLITPFGCCGAVRSSTFAGVRAALFAAGTPRPIGAGTSAFGWCSQGSDLYLSGLWNSILRWTLEGDLSLLPHDGTKVMETWPATKCMMTGHANIKPCGIGVLTRHSWIALLWESS